MESIASARPSQDSPRAALAQRIGASRETVTRLLSDLKRKDLIKLEGTTLIIKNRTALEAMAV